MDTAASLADENDVCSRRQIHMIEFNIFLSLYKKNR